MPYKVELPPDLDDFLGGLSLSKNTGDRGDSCDHDNGLTEGRIIAVDICSTVLKTRIWLAFNDEFDPKDGQAIFYADELPLLRTKTPQQLKEIYKAKLAFPGCRIVQEGPKQ